MSLEGNGIKEMVSSTGADETVANGTKTDQGLKHRRVPEYTEVTSSLDVKKESTPQRTGIINSTKYLVQNLQESGSRSQVAHSSTFSQVFTYINHCILLMVFFLFSIYNNYLYVYRRIRLRFLNLAYYPNQSPQIIRDDVNKLTKIPKRLSCILNLKGEDDENGGIDGLISDVSELIAWSVSSGIKELNIYEYNGVINDYYSELDRYATKNLKNYFGTDFIPNISIKIPHLNKKIVNRQEPVDLSINLLSQVDGKPTIVELTKTISELAINKELLVKDISIELINEELIELVGNEPDLLIIFSPNLDLQNYPPWHIRLTEIYWEPDNWDVNYAVFIRALQNYAKSKVNVGK